MLTRRRFVEYSALSSAMLAYRPLLWGQQAPARSPRLAILGSVYRYQSNMQTLVDRFMTANGTCLTCKWSPSMWISWSAKPMRRLRPTSLQ
jgi:hypothetical protein